MVGDHDKERWPKVVASKTAGKAPSRPDVYQQKKTEYGGCLGGSSVVLVVAYGGGGDGGTGGE